MRNPDEDDDHLDGLPSRHKQLYKGFWLKNDKITVLTELVDPERLQICEQIAWSLRRR